MEERYTMRIIVYIVGDDVCCIVICPKVSAKPKLSRNEFLRASMSTSQAFHGYAGQRTESGTVCGSGLGVRGLGPELGAIWRVVVMPHSVRQVLRRRVGFACLLAPSPEPRAPTRSLATILLAREFVGDGGEQ